MLFLTFALALLACDPGTQKIEGGDDTDSGPIFTNGDGFPELTGSPVPDATIAAGDTLHVQIPVDSDTVYTRVAAQDYATTTVNLRNWAELTSGPTTKTADLWIPDSTPPGKYYITVDLCSSDACTDPYDRVQYNRGGGDEYDRKDFTSPPLTQVGKDYGSGIPVVSFTVD